MQFLDDFFYQYLSSKKGMPLIDGIGSYSVVFSVEFTDVARSWVITVSNGMIANIVESIDASAVVRFIVTQDSFYQIVSKKLSPQTAFFSRQTDIKGNLFEGMKLAKILSCFFQNHPYSGAGLEHND